jgi:putative FmdB family regulatory protein
VPLYEFECKCGKIRTEFVKMGTETIKCSSCGEDMHKIISASHFHLKGKNWYKDHYGLKSGKKGKKDA